MRLSSGRTALSRCQRGRGQQTQREWLSRDLVTVGGLLDAPPAARRRALADPEIRVRLLRELAGSEHGDRERLVIEICLPEASSAVVSELVDDAFREQIE
jgi:hypothetical protein